MGAAPTVLTQTGVGRSSIWTPDWFETPFNIGVGCIAVGTVTYNIEHTFDDPSRLVLVPPWGIASGTLLTFPSVPLDLMAVGRPVIDLTTPAAITGGQTVSSFTANTVTLSGALNAAVVAGDRISFLSWFQNSGLNGQTGNANGNYAFPVRGITINVTGGTGTVIATLIQATTPP